MQASRSLHISITLFIICFISLNADAQKRSKPRVRPPASPEISYDQRPFNPDLEQLPARYIGHSLLDIYAILLKRKASTKKDEFESTIDYQSRIRRLNQLPLTGGLNADSLFAFVINPEDTQFQTHYDADMTALDIKLLWRHTSGYKYSGIDNPYLALTYSERLKDLGTYIGRNAFNRSVKVLAYRKDEFLLSSEAQYLRDFESVKKDYTSFWIETSLIMPPTDARLAKSNLRTLIVCHLAEQPTYENMDHDTATISDPYERYTFSHTLNIVPEEIWFYNVLTGNVYIKLKPVTQ